MTKPIVYVAGPMTGYPLMNYTAFGCAAEWVRSQGGTPINPAELNPAKRAWWLCMVVDLWHLRLADRLLLLPGWQRSRGARLEVACAVLLGLPIDLFRGEDVHAS
jgi:hypothetical protein